MNMYEEAYPSAQSRWLLVSGDFVHAGGQDRANHALAHHLARRGDELHLAAHRIASELQEFPNVHTHLIARPRGSHLLGGPLLAWGASRCARSLAALPGGVRVVVNGGNCSLLAGAVNWVHYVHSAWTPAGEGSPLRRWKTKLSHRLGVRDERASLRRAGVVITNSDRTNRDVVERLFVDPERVHTVYYGIDADLFATVTPGQRAEGLGLVSAEGLDVSADAPPGSDPPLVAFVGALGDRRKGFDTLYEAWKRAKTIGNWDARMVVMGAGAGVAIWKARTQADGLDREIAFLGHRRDLPKVLAACDLMVCPARYEAYGLNAHEAICRGIPAIVPAAAGVAERYPGELAALVLPDPIDAELLAQKLIEWRRDRHPLAHAAAIAADTLRARSWDHCAAEIVALAEAIPSISARPARRRGLAPHPDSGLAVVATHLASAPSEPST